MDIVNVKKIILSLLLTAALIIAGCGKTPAVNNTQNDGMIIANYDFTGNKHNVKFTKVPEKIVVCGNNAIDTLMALGAKDKIAVAVTNNLIDKNKYQKLLPTAAVYEYAPSQEALLTLQPDFILAQRRYFDGKVFGDTTFWEQNNIPAYIQEASGPIPALGNFPPCTVDSEKQFITNIGKIFHKEKEAAKIIESIELELQNVPVNIQNKPKVLVVEFMNDNIEVFGKNLLSGDIVSKLGGVIIDFGAPFISMENLIQTDADVVFVVYHGGDDARQAALDKMKRDIFKQIKGVSMGKVYPLPYNLIVAAGIHTDETIKFIKNGMYN